MKKFYLFIYILFLTFLSFLCFCMKVNAKDMPVSPDVFYIDNQTSDPFVITLSGNSSANHTFNYANLVSVNSVNDREGDYFMFSVVSNKKINIQRRYAVGTHCSIDCWSNESYLSLVSKNGSAYNYLFYFSKKLTHVTLGTQYITYEVHDDFTFTNLESGTATINIYGVYASDNNPLPDVLEQNASAINIIEGNNNNTNTIIENDNDNTNTIIDNDNANTDKIIESNKVCNTYDKNSIEIDNNFLQSDGSYNSNNNYGITKYFKLNSNSTIKVLSSFNSDAAKYCFYNTNKELISCNSINTSLVNTYLTIPSNTEYFRSSINKNINKPTFEICINGNQATNDSINNLNDNITSNDIDNPNSDLDDISNMIAENGVITNLLSLPITLYSKILNSVNGTCSSYNLGTLFGTSITFSCISLQSLLGNTIWGVIDILFSGFTIFAIAKKMIKVFNNMSSLKEGDVIDD